jgi:hypothetical protein
LLQSLAMTDEGDRSPSPRPLAPAGPILVIAGIGLAAVVGLVFSLFFDPGLPAHLSDSYMRVAGGLVSPSTHTAAADALSAQLASQPPGAVRVPSLDAIGYRLAGGGHVTLGGRPAALAIYRNTLQDLVVWHAAAGDVASWPATTDVRDQEGRRFYVHHKATTIIAAWQEGGLAASITSALPADHVMAVARAAAAGARP